MTSNEYTLHAILYAKGHYKQDRKMTGLRIIAGHYGGMDPEYVNDEHLMQFVMMLLEKYAPKADMREILSSTFKDCWMWRPRRQALKRVTSINRLDVVQSCLYVLRHMMVRDLPPLPVASADVAPLKDK
jgi:hypothetical protein